MSCIKWVKRFFLASCWLCLLACANGLSNPVGHGKNFHKALIFSDDFSEGLDPHRWVVEVDPLPNSGVRVVDGRLVIDTAGGATVWANKIFDGDIEIEYTRTVVHKQGVNDRVSDMNQFWMAQEVGGKAFFSRSGKFEQYDNLLLYYVGVGGNTNTTTRFRKYHGDGTKPLLEQHLDSQHLLKANREYRIRITVIGDTTQFFVDDILYFSYTDPEPIRRGYFGIRSTSSRHAIDRVRVYQLQPRT